MDQLYRGTLGSHPCQEQAAVFIAETQCHGLPPGVLVVVAAAVDLIEIHQTFQREVVLRNDLGRGKHTTRLLYHRLHHQGDDPRARTDQLRATVSVTTMNETDRAVENRPEPKRENEMKEKAGKKGEVKREATTRPEF